MEASFVGLPLPWNQQLVSILPAKDKLMLFKTCSFWAQQVVQHTSRSTLRIGKKHRKGPPPAAARVDAQRIIITKLLSGSRNINIELLERDNVPFPSACCPHITAVRLEYAAPFDSLPSIPWEHLTSLEYLGVAYKASAGVITQLCSILEAGHMPQLCKLRMPVSRATASSLGQVHFNRLAAAVGQRLVHLTTNSSELLHCLQCFTVLHSAEFQYGELSAEAGRQLCSHPTLRHVSFNHCNYLYGNHQYSKCNWDTLTLEDCRPQLPARLPIADLKEIKIQNSINDHMEKFDEADRLALRFVLASCGSKIVCEGADGSFRLCDVSRETVQLLSRMRNVQRLKLQHTFYDTEDEGDDTEDEGDDSESGSGSDRASLQPRLDMQHKAVLYAALPPSIRHITFVTVKNLDWAQLWQGMPSTVHSVSILDCDVCASDAIALIQAVPAHINRINLRESYVTASGCVRGNDKRAVQWQAAGLQDMAPAHVTLYLQTPDDDIKARYQAGLVDE